MTTMNQSQYAQHSGVDRKTIGRWIKAGRFIVMDGDLIDVEASDAALKKTAMEKIRGHRTRRRKRPRRSG
jgi:predicted site-specific integrase-resolvase